MAMTMAIPHNSSAKRITVQIPTSPGDPIEAWVYRPEDSGPQSAVVMAHGIGGIKAGGLAPFTERFREEGFAAIAFGTLRYLADIVGFDRLMMGSDMPFPIGDLQPLKLIAETGFSGQESASINGGLAAKLFA
jgi:hypothetical protein